MAARSFSEYLLNGFLPLKKEIKCATIVSAVCSWLDGRNPLKF